MANNLNDDAVIANPTYMSDIRHFFEDVDLEHMGLLGVDLSTYDGVRSNSTRIFLQTQPPNANMPPEADRKWSVARSQTFRNWIMNGFPRGAADTGGGTGPEPDPDATIRYRKDVRDLSQDEIDKLRAAFEGLFARSADAEDSFFQLAGIHWYPAPNFCVHGEHRYNPWHRVYLRKFEDAMRTVPGCEDVTLPYWDITDRIPDVLYEAPFDSYTLPIEIHPSFPAGYATDRNAADAIKDSVEGFNIPEVIDSAGSQSVWESFNTAIMGAHNSGHGACGVTMSNADAAAFDPLFWFFHCNWDRLWWKWQNDADAATLQKFRTTLSEPADWLEPPFNNLPGFDTTADQAISMPDIVYLHPGDAAPAEMVPEERGSICASTPFTVCKSDKVSIRVKGIHRLHIPGSFSVHLRADGETIAKRGFFQSMTPRACSNCREKDIVHIDFVLPYDYVAGRELRVCIQLERPDRIGEWYPLSSCGNPTVNIRYLLQEH